MVSKTQAISRKPIDAALHWRIVAANDEYARICREAIKSMPRALRAAFDLGSLAIVGSTESADQLAPTLFVWRLNDIPEQAITRTWNLGQARHLVILEGLPVEAVAARLPWLAIRNPRRIHVTTANQARVAEVIRRLLRGLVQQEGPPRVVDAWLENDHLVLLSAAFERLPVPLAKLAKFIGSGVEDALAFEFDEDGSFLYWPHTDVHLGWDQFLQLVDPAAALADRQKLAAFNQEYGAAIRAIREQRGLKQSDIAGLTQRHLRRIEHGQQAASRKALGWLAKAHGMSLDAYLAALADQMRQHPVPIQ